MTSQTENRTAAAKKFLRQTSLFAGIAEPQLTNIFKDVVSRRFDEGKIIFHQGDPGLLLYLIKSGQVRIFVNASDGTETSVILYGRPGDFFGELAVIDGLTRSASAIALRKTILYIINREDFRNHMIQYPQLALNFMKELSVRVRYNTSHINSLTSLDVPRRLARKLVELAQDYGQIETDGVLLDMTLTQTNLASLIGATRESTNKSLSEFRQQGWIRLFQGKIIILDPDALRGQVTAH